MAFDGEIANKMEADAGEQSSSTDLSPNPNKISELNLFKKTCYKDRNEKMGQSMVALNREAVRAWKALSEFERMKYTEKVEKVRPQRKMVKSQIFFYTQCSPLKFKALAEFLDTSIVEVIGAGEKNLNFPIFLAYRA